MPDFQWFGNDKPVFDQNYAWFGNDKLVGSDSLDTKESIQGKVDSVFGKNSVPLPGGGAAEATEYDRVQTAKDAVRYYLASEQGQSTSLVGEVMRSNLATRDMWFMAAGIKASQAASRISEGDKSFENYKDIAVYLEEGRKFAEEYKRMSTFRKVSDGILQTVGFMSAIAGGAPAAKGMEALVAGGAKAGATGAAKAGVARTIAGAVAGEAARLAVSPGLQQMVAQETVSRMAPKDAGLGGLEAGDPFVKALAKAVPKQIITQLTERAGGALHKLPGLSKLKSNIAGGRPIRNAAEWDGFVGEWVEERLDEGAQGLYSAILGEGFQFGPTADVLSGDPQRISQGMQDLLVEGAIIGAISGPGAVADATNRMVRSKQLKPIAEQWKRGGSVHDAIISQNQDALKEAIPRDAVEAWALQPENADAVSSLIEQDTPSRTKWKETGLVPATTDVRKQFVSDLKEIQNASQVRTDQASATEEGNVGDGSQVDSGGEVRQQGTNEEGAVGASEVTPAREVQVAETTPVGDKFEITTPAKKEVQAPPKSQEQQKFESEATKNVQSVPIWKGATVEFEGRKATVTTKRGHQARVFFDSDTDVDYLEQHARGEQAGKKANALYLAKDGQGYEAGIYLRSGATVETLGHEAIHWAADSNIITAKEVEKYGGEEKMAVAFAKWVGDGRKAPNKIFRKLYQAYRALLNSQDAFFNSIGKRTEAPASSVTSAEEKVAPESPKTVETQQATEKPLSEMNMAELRAIATPMGIKGTSKKALAEKIQASRDAKEAPPKTLREKQAAEEQAADKVGQEILGMLQNKGLMVYRGKKKPGLDTEILNKVIEWAGHKIRAKGYQAGAALQEFLEAHGLKGNKKAEANLKPYFEEVERQNAPPEPPPVSEGSETTGIRHAKTDELRENTGIPERVPVKGMGWEEADAEAKRLMDEDPTYAPRLVQEMVDDPTRGTNRMEQATLTRYLRDLENRRKDGDDVYDELLLAVEASALSGSEAGATLQFRQAEMAPDFSLHDMVRRYTQDVGEKPTKEMLDKLAALADELEKSKAETEQANEIARQAQIDKQIAEAKLAKRTPPSEKVGTKRARLVKQKNDATSAFKQAWNEAVKAAGGSIATSGGLNPEALAALGKAAKAAAEVVKAYSALNINTFMEFISKVQNDIGSITPDQVKIFKQEWEKERGSEDLPMGDNPSREAVGVRAKQLLRAAVESGITENKEVIKAVHDQLALEGVRQSESDTMDAITDYGKFYPLPPGHTEAEIRRLRGEIRQMRKIQDAQNAIDTAKKLLAQGMSSEDVAKYLQDNKLLPKATGRERATPESIERDLISQVNELKKQLPVSAEAKAGQLKTALSTAKTAVNNRLEVLDNEIAALKKAIADKTKLQKPLDKTPGPTDADLDALRAKLAERQQQKKELKKNYDRIFPQTKEQRIRSAQQQEQDALRQIEKLENILKDIKEGREAPKSSKENLTPPEIQNRLKALRERVKSAKKAAKEAELARFEGEGGGLSSNEQKQNAQRIKMAENMLKRLIAEAKADAAAGRLESKGRAAPVTSQSIEQMRDELASLRAAREEARKASPEYQAKEEARRLEQHKKSLDRQLAFWEKRKEDAKNGILPGDTKKQKTPEDQEALDKRIAVDKKKREAQEFIAKEMRKRWKAWQWAQATGEEFAAAFTSIVAGLEASFTLRQGVFYVGHPIRTARALGHAAIAAWSERMAYAYEEDIFNRPNARNGEYKEAAIQFTKEDGPVSNFEELTRSNFMRWLANTESKWLLLPRFPAKFGYIPADRAWRTFNNIMRADLYDVQRSHTTGIRQFFHDKLGMKKNQWSEDDIKIAGRTANILSGRGTGLQGSTLSRIVFWAPRWVWSRIQAEFLLPLNMMTPRQLQKWEMDPAMRIAHAELYARAIVAAIAHISLVYFYLWLMADDDDKTDDEPTIELTDLTSTDLFKPSVGGTHVDALGGMQQPLVFMSRVIKAVEATTTDEDAGPYAKDAFDLGMQQVRYKLSVPAGAAMDFLTGKTAVGEELPKGLGPRALEILKRRSYPMAYGDMFDALKNLGFKQGAGPAALAFLGDSVNTYGDRVKFKNGTPEEKEEQFKKDLKKMTWNGEPLEYSDLLTATQRKAVEDQYKAKRGQVFYDATHEVKSETDENKQKAKEKMEKNKGFAQQMKDEGVSHLEAQKLFIDYLISRDTKTKFSDTYFEESKRLAELYGADWAKSQAAITAYRVEQLLKSQK